jgi:hypothetical protein
MFVSPKGTFCLLLLSLVKLECDGEKCGRNVHIHSQSIQLILPPVIGKYELTRQGVSAETVHFLSALEREARALPCIV